MEATKESTHVGVYGRVVSSGTFTLTPEKFIIEGAINADDILLEISLHSFASIPFKPGCRIEVQHNNTTYRCVLEDGLLPAKFVNMVENFMKQYIQED